MYLFLPSFASMIEFRFPFENIELNFITFFATIQHMQCHDEPRWTTLLVLFVVNDSSSLLLLECILKCRSFGSTRMFVYLFCEKISNTENNVQHFRFAVRIFWLSFGSRSIKSLLKHVKIVVGVVHKPKWFYSFPINMLLWLPTDFSIVLEFEQ